MIGRLLLQTTLPGAGTPVEGVPLAARAMGLVGLATMIGIAWLLSSDRKRIPWRLVGTGVALQAVLGFLVLKTGVGRALFNGTNVAFTELLSFTEQGARFIFGNLVRNNVPVGTPAGTVREVHLTQVGGRETRAEIEYGKHGSFDLPKRIVLTLDIPSVEPNETIGFGPPEQKPKRITGRIEITYSNYQVNTGLKDELFKAK